MNPIQVVDLSNSQDVDGTLATAASGEITGELVRIVATDNNLRIAIAKVPIATTTSIFIPALGEIWLPITSGHKVAVLGGIANISVAGN